MEKKLFIIGNGFDIQHNIRSKYQDFHSFIRENYSLHRDFAYMGVPAPKIEYYGMKHSDLEYALAFLDDTLTKTESGSHWYDLENSLGKLDLSDYFDKNDGWAPVRIDEKPEDTIYNIGQCFYFLMRIFNLWVDQIDISNVVANNAFKELINPDNDIFLTFNYTKVLEDVYSAQNVYHIHGKQGDRKKEFGHIKRDDKYIQSFCEENGISTNCFEGVSYLFEITEKDTEQICESSRAFFDSICNGISDIYSYGFSFSQVDMIYIDQICRSMDTSSITWYLSDFSSPDEIADFKNRITKSGFQGTFKTFHIPSNKALKSNDGGVRRIFQLLTHKLNDKLPSKF